MWKQDKYLRRISKQIESAKLVSFDVFDTVLFRTVSAPHRIFFNAGKRLNELYLQYGFSDEVFAGMRREADALARKRVWENSQYEDVTLDEIYDEFCFDDEYKMHAKECELETEARYVYLNCYMESFLRYCREQGKKVAMVSDTYFSEQQIKRLLEGSGFDTSLVDFFIISSENRVLKYNGKLFKKLIEAVPGLNLQDLLHIGDNRTADIEGADIAGIRAEHYPVIPCSGLHPLIVEPFTFGTVEAILSLRKHACALVPDCYNTSEEITLFEMGASVFGAVYSAFAEWIIEQCINEDIDVIVAFMREGELLGEIIDRAVRNKSLNLSVKTMFISRRTTEIIAFGTIDEGVIDKYIYRYRLLLSDLFSIFYLDIGKTVFSADGDLTVAQYMENGRFDSLRAYFTQPSTLREINEKVCEQKTLLIDYFRSLTEGKNTVTVDVGFKGTMQACLSDIGANGNAKLLHLLMMGLPYNNKFLLKGLQIRGWLGYGDENRETVERLYRRIQVLEAVTNADTGTTLAYEKIDGEIIPVLENVSINENNTKKKKILWQGIQQFQDCWFTLIFNKPFIVNEVIEDKVGFFGILSRLMLMPTHAEATTLGEMYYDESIIFSDMSTLIREIDKQCYRSIGRAEAFIDACMLNRFRKHIYWPEGVASMMCSTFFTDRYVKLAGSPIHRKVWKFWNNNNFADKRIAVYGAGAIGRELVSILFELGLEIVFIVDANPDLHGQSIYGKKIVSLEESADKTDVDVYIITPHLFEEEIRKNLVILTSDMKEVPNIITYKYYVNIFEGK